MSWPPDLVVTVALIAFALQTTTRKANNMNQSSRAPQKYSTFPHTHTITEPRKTILNNIQHSIKHTCLRHLSYVGVAQQLNHNNSPKHSRTKVTVTSTAARYSTKRRDAAREQKL